MEQLRANPVITAASTHRLFRTWGHKETLLDEKAIQKQQIIFV